MIPPHTDQGGGVTGVCWCAPAVGFGHDDGGRVFVAIVHDVHPLWMYHALAYHGQPPA